MSDANNLPQLDLSQSQPIGGLQDSTAAAPPTTPNAAPLPQQNLPQLDLSQSQPIQWSGTPSATAPEQPGVLSRTKSGVMQGMQEVLPAPPADHREALVTFLGGPQALVAYKAGKSVVNAVENIIKPPQTPAPNAPSAYQQAVQDFHKTVQQFRNRDYRDATSSAVSTGADVFSTMPGPGTFVGPQVREISEGARPGADLATPLARNLTKDVLLGGTIMAPELAEGEEAEAAAPKVATSPVSPKRAAVANATSKSGISVGTPETVPPTGENIQPDLHQGIRDFVNKTNAENGLPPVPDKVNVLDAAQNQADAFQTRSQATFDKMEKITGINPTAQKQIMSARADQIENLLAAGKDEEAGNLQQLQLNDENRMTKAFNDAKAKGVDVDQARSDWNRSLRADELSNAIRGSKSNISTLDNPDIDPNKLTSRLQKLYESQPGGKTAKLAQLGGDQNATTLVEHAETARDATRVIKEFVPQSATGQQALSKIVSDNTIEKSSLIRGGKAVGRTDWNGVVKDIGNLTPEQQNAFGGELAQVRQYAGKQALRQNAISLLKKGAYTVGGLSVGGEIIKHVLP